LRLAVVLWLAVAAPSMALPQEAARHTEPGAGKDDVRQWIAEFASPLAATREAAAKALIAAGPRVMPEIYEALESRDAEVRKRAEFVAQALEARAAKHLGLKLRVPPQVLPGVRSAHFVGRKLAVQDVQHLVCLYRLERLVLRDTEITDDVLQHVGQLRSLNSLNLYSEDAAGKATDSIRITDEG
jgi:hypothetical protein